jgi:predicted cupin superfamily sugar epimerase
VARNAGLRVFRDKSGADGLEKGPIRCGGNGHTDCETALDRRDLVTGAKMTEHQNAQYWIDHLGLIPHPEGGYYRSTYKSALTIARSALPPTFHGDCSASTAIYFLLDGINFSAFHRIASDEVWHFYTGSALIVYVIDPDGNHSELHLGDRFDAGEAFQAVVKAGCWFASRVKDATSFALVGCTVAPGFEFVDFELATRSQLIRTYPAHQRLIEELTRV